MLRKIFLFSVAFALFACSSSSKREEANSSKEKATKANLIELKKKCLPDNVRPVKGKFLDYIYMIRPDHKQPGYHINTFWLGNGYAYGEGPYDGLLFEFFLFRGKPRDLVLMQQSGYETGENQKFGSIITPYFFEKNEMTSGKLEDVFPVKDIDKLFADQTEKFKKTKVFQNRKESWSFFNLIRLPLTGTVVELKICRDPQDNPFLADSPCALVGHMRWAKSKFVLERINSFQIENEKY